MSKVGFIGVGNMGAPMASNIARGGHSVTAFDLNGAAVTRLASVGVAAATSAAAAAKDADFVITMLPNAQHIEAAAFGAEGFAAQMAPGATYIDMSTIAPSRTDTIGQRMLSHNVAVLDAPVGRQQSHAVAGKLLIMVGADKVDFDRVRPVLELMGDTIVHCGGRGAGSRMKVVNNFMSIALNSLSSEALVLAEKSGLDPEMARDVMLGTVAGQGHLGSTYPSKVLKGDTMPGFMIDLAYKDMGLAVDLGSELDVDLSTGRAAITAYDRAREDGRGRQDWTAIYLSARTAAGLA